MKWLPEAEAAIRKVPFFVRKRVRARVEREAEEAGRPVVSLADVKATQARYLGNMAKDVKGYQLESCFGPSGCPNRAVESGSLLARIEKQLQEADLIGFLRREVGDHLKFHHEFRVAVADCPNACSQPQIKDIGVIGACLPVRTEAECTFCEACVEICKEDAFRLEAGRGPHIDVERCVRCGQCVTACPSAALSAGVKGYRVLLGGKLGRHPQLGRELPGIYDEDQVVGIIAACLEFYKRHSTGGGRFAQILTPEAFEALKRKISRA